MTQDPTQAMNKLNWKTISAALEARKVEERAVLLAAGLAVLAYAWLVLVQDVLSANQLDVSRRITITSSQIIEQTNRQAEIEGSFTSDPNALALQRQRELRAAATEVDARLGRLYGALISPREMSLALTSILQRETSLRLVSLENLAPEALVTTSILDAAATAGAAAGNVQVFRHGLRITLSGSFLETIKFLRSVEQLDSNFFWEDLSFSITNHPDADITLNIYTLGTERGWIGV
jgi:MSHA biogenesis protein MshJ